MRYGASRSKVWSSFILAGVIISELLAKNTPQFLHLFKEMFREDINAAKLTSELCVHKPLPSSTLPHVIPEHI